MPVLRTKIDPTTERFVANRAAFLDKIAELDGLLEETLVAGGERAISAHRARGKLTARERIELLLDLDAPFLELQPLVALGTQFVVGGGMVTGIGPIEGVECVVIANDATVRGGTMNPYGTRKILRAHEIAEENRLPVVHLVESGGGDLPTQAENFMLGGRVFRDQARRSAMGVADIVITFGNATAGGAYFPGLADENVFVRGNAKVFLGGPPLVKMATGEESTDEELGGAEMHARVSGLAEYLAEDELDALRLGRQIVRRLNHRKHGPGPSEPADEPVHDEEELLGIASVDLKVPFDPREVIARVVDGSRYDEFKPLYGTSLSTGWASIHGYPVGILANAQGILFSQEAQKATHFIQLANQRDVPLLFIHNTTGYMVGREYEQAGIIKDGSKMINAVSNSRVPHITLLAGASYGAGNYGMSGRAYAPRFVFAWPNSKQAVMGPQQLAGVLSIVAQAAAEKRGIEFDEDADRERREAVEEQIESESLATAMSGRGYDDGIIDPRDTRTVLGIALSACHGAPVEGVRDAYGIFRM